MAAIKAQLTPFFISMLLRTQLSALSDVAIVIVDSVGTFETQQEFSQESRIVVGDTRRAIPSMYALRKNKDIGDELLLY